jgi:hypothetical protein
MTRTIIAAAIIAGSANVQAEQQADALAYIARNWSQNWPASAEDMMKNPSEYFGPKGVAIVTSAPYDEAVETCQSGKDEWAEKAKRQAKRDAIREAEMQARRDAIKLRIGAGESSMLFKYGRPEKVNRTVSAAGVHKQIIYPDLTIYTEDGIVTSWQD